MNIFKASRLSTIRFINELRPISTQFIDWDSGSDLQDLPSEDIIGINGFSVANIGKFHLLHFGVTVAVLNDPHCFRVTDYIDLFYTAMLPEKEFLIYDSITALPVGKAIFRDGALTTPINRFETRVSQSVQGSAVITLT